ncbi:MAG: FAD:protein FMN transferase [Cyclobacteriaceae bacterium]|nr:FAD:protein FMN transferase [Cyclobacteriaceae bacterium]
MFAKNRILPVILILLVFIVWKIRQNSDREERVSFNGQTMGTYYNIIYLHPDGALFKKEVDSLLVIWNNSLSTYIKDSEISRFNRSSEHYFESPYFYPVLNKSREIYEVTGGAFDPTVMPLVNAWGFGPEEQEMPDSSEVEKLLKHVSYSFIDFDSVRVWKKKNGVQLDFSAIAKGYGVDVVGDFLGSKGIGNYLVDIGGEITCKGVNDRGIPWTTGIEDPQVQFSERKIMAVIEVSNKGIATSGNYRNFYVVDGQKYAHTISPFTGFPVQHSLLSATVVAEDCMTADGFATAFMVLGIDPSIQILNDHPELDAYFIFSDEQGNLKTYMTEGFNAILQKDV